MDLLVGYILLGGVLVSAVLMVGGMAWHWVAIGRPQIGYTIAGMDLFQFVVTDVRQVASGALQPRLLINLGLAVLLLTPYVRVVASTLYFAAGERNWKYTLITGFVFTVLTYSLFLR